MELTSAGPFHRLEKVHLSCLSKGRGSFGGCGHRRVTLIRDVKRDVGNLLLLPTLSFLRRRLQVEKSPVGTTTELSVPRIASGRGTPGFLRHGSQGHRLCFGAYASLAPLGDLSLRPVYRRVRLGPERLGWRKGGSVTSRHRLTVVRWKRGGQLQEKHQALCGLHSPPPAAA